MSAFQMKPPKNMDFEVPPAGTHPAVLVAIVDLGTQTTNFQGEERSARKVCLVWELVSEKKANGANHIIGRDYTLSFAKKASLRQLVEKWRGREFGEDEQFDLGKLAGRECLLSLVHKESASGNTFAKVEGVAQPPKNMKIGKATNPTVMWELGSTDAFPDHDWLPYSYGKKLIDVVQQSKEYKNNGKAETKETAKPQTDEELGAALKDELDSTIPF